MINERFIKEVGCLTSMKTGLCTYLKPVSFELNGTTPYTINLNPGCVIYLESIYISAILPYEGNANLAVSVNGSAGRYLKAIFPGPNGPFGGSNIPFVGYSTSAIIDCFSESSVTISANSNVSPGNVISVTIIHAQVDLS